jgi:hypothetical protein
MCSVLEDEVLLLVLKASHFYHQWLTHDKLKSSAGAGGADKALYEFG